MASGALIAYFSRIARASAKVVASGTVGPEAMVPGDDPGTIASGPTVPDATTFAEARAILEKYAITAPDAVAAHLAAAADETPKPGDARLADARAVVIARPQESLEAAAAEAREAGIEPVILGDDIEGEARDVGRSMAAQALEAVERQAPLVLLSGGETTVTLHGQGRGGRNTEFLLALGIAAGGHPSIHAIACDTDGIDGSEDNAGALFAPDSLDRAHSAGLDPQACLDANDSYGFFDTLGDLIKTGPTRTNVNDFRAVLVLPKS